MAVDFESSLKKYVSLELYKCMWKRQFYVSLMFQDGCICGYVEKYETLYVFWGFWVYEKLRSVIHT